MPDHSLDLEIDRLVEPHDLMRLVDRDSLEYLELRDSLRQYGFINSIAVCPADTPGYYEIIDGFYRYCCSKEIGLTVIPCLVKEGIDRDTYLALQLQAQAIRPETKPVEFALQLKKLMKRRPELSLAQLQNLVRKSTQWISQRLGLLGLLKDIQKMVDRGEIKLQSAYMLSKIPKHLQRHYVEKAITLPAPQFKALAASVIKQFAEAVKQGKMEAFWTEEVQLQPFLRPVKDISAELERRENGPLIVVAEKCETPLDGFYAALRWASQIDTESIVRRENLARLQGRKVFYDDGLEKV